MNECLDHSRPRGFYFLTDSTDEELKSSIVALLHGSVSVSHEVAVETTAVAGVVSKPANARESTLPQWFIQRPVHG